MLKPGDKVKFLNASGGGVVVRVIDSRMVGVLGEEGFEIPTLASELIKIDSKEPGARFFEGNGGTGRGKEDPPMESPPDTDHRLKSIPKGVAVSGRGEEVLLAFIPHDQKWLVTGLLDIYMINRTSYDLLYNIFGPRARDGAEGLDYGSIFPNSSLLIATIDREALSLWTGGSLQFLFHKELVSDVIPPFNAEIRIEGKRFFKEGNYREHPLIDGKGILVKVLSLTDFLNGEPAGPERDETVEQESVRPLSLLERHVVAPREAEVDLHVHELVEDPANLEKSEILDFQKRYFVRCMEEALERRFLKITFIHGVGNGVLKTELVNLLKNYRGIEFFDAPVAKYGVGALEVRIPHNG